ncbi:MAG TPA: response regulator transcription factor [Stellaceae bacterium]|nr:response regulator transcription factor [Stellaceae bacterium]
MKILIVDDHDLLRDGLRQLCARSYEGIEILDAVDLQGAHDMLDRHGDIALTVLDLHLSDADGLRALVSLRERHKTMPIIVLSALEDPLLMREALARGALGYIPKSLNTREIWAAIETVMEGGVFIPPLLRHAAAPPPTRANFEALSKRHREVLALMAEGRNNDEIATSLGLAENTVRVHVGAILKLLDARNRTQAVNAARRFGLVR